MKFYKFSSVKRERLNLIGFYKINKAHHLYKNHNCSYSSRKSSPYRNCSDMVTIVIVRTAVCMGDIPSEW